MRLLSLALVGVSALVLSSCDDVAPRRQAKADCCCKDSCPTRAPKADGEAKAKTTETVEVATREETVRTGGRRHKVVRHGGGSYHRYSYRSGTEGVGYLDEESGYRGGGYRRVGGSVSVEESESYSESARYSESGSGYSYSSGGGGVVVYDSGGRRIEGRGGSRRGGGGYAGVDRDGYLTWPGKTQ